MVAVALLPDYGRTIGMVRGSPDCLAIGLGNMTRRLLCASSVGRIDGRALLSSGVRVGSCPNLVTSTAGAITAVAVRRRGWGWGGGDLELALRAQGAGIHSVTVVDEVLVELLVSSAGIIG